MTLNQQPSAQRIHIGFFGMRNAGKSSVVNAVTGQAMSIVSPVKGTTTDPVQRAMELLPLGPVVIIDTPGIDDEGELGSLRAQRSRRVLDRTDLAVLVQDATLGESPEDRALMEELQRRRIPFVVVRNKADLLPGRPEQGEQALYVSALSGEGIQALKERITALARQRGAARPLVADLLKPGDLVLLVTPMDEAAPKGRLILPQQQVIRDCLDAGCIPVLTRPEELPGALSSLAVKPRLVITDSQAFGRVHRMLPEDQPLTSFSILFSRYKGTLTQAVLGAARLDSLQPGDAVLISEGCTHHRQCGDIGSVKLPAWIRQHVKAELQFSFSSGVEFPEDLSAYALVLHCGGCMLNEREMQSRSARAQAGGVPMTNYGIAIAHMHGILHRSLAPFPEMQALLHLTPSGRDS